MTSLPSPPFYEIEGVPNLRDIGGYALYGGGSVWRGFIYRSAQLEKITPRGCETLVSELGVKTIYDLRFPEEKKRSPAPSIPGATIHSVPVYQDRDMTADQKAQDYRYYFREDLDIAIPNRFAFVYTSIWHNSFSFKYVLKHILEHPEEPFLFFSTLGKDRTGFLATLILRLAGVEDFEIFAGEYSLSEMGLKADQGFYNEQVQRLLQDPLTEGNLRGIERLLSAQKDSMKVSMVWFDRHTGGVRRCLTDFLGFSKEEVKKMKATVRVRDPPIL